MNPTPTRQALVIGGSRGIGLASARELERLGYDVVSTSRHSGSYQCDLASFESILALSEVLARENRLPDTLVVSAGIVEDGLAIKSPFESFEHVVDINLVGTARAIRQFLPAMVRERFGRIIVIGSVSSAKGNAGQWNYCAAKAGLAGMTRALVREYARRGVTFNVVAPGFIDTDMLDGVSDRALATAKAECPAGRFGTPEEVAHCIGYLASVDAAYVNGAVIPVDGGFGMGM